MGLFSKVVSAAATPLNNAVSGANTVLGPVADGTAPVIDGAGDVIEGVADPLQAPVENLAETIDTPVADLAQVGVNTGAAGVTGVANLLGNVELNGPTLPSLGGDGTPPPPPPGDDNNDVDDLADGVAEVVDPIYALLDPLLNPVEGQVIDLTPEASELSVLLAALGLIVGDTVNRTGLEDELPPVIELLQPIDELVGEIDFSPLYDSIELLVTNGTDELNSIVGLVRAALPGQVENIIDDLPSLGITGEQQIFNLYEEGGVLSDLDNNVVGEKDAAVDLGGVLTGADGAGLENTGDVFDDLNGALEPLDNVDVVGDLVGGGDSGAAGLFVDTLGVGI